jgi:DNA-directed RNA polymerase subunit M/transcription elongation factor TFIIS
MNRTLPTFQAKCGSCGQLFAHPSLGDQAYGETVLCNSDGSAYAWVSAFSKMPQRVKALMPNMAEGFWNVIASMADPIEGKCVSNRIHCPKCSAETLEFWEGDQIGSAEVPEATFQVTEALSLSELKARIELNQ